MKSIEQIVEELRQPGIPRSAVVHLRFSNGVAQQERVTTLTLQDLQALATVVWAGAEFESMPRRDDRRENDRHPPRSL